MNDEAKRRGRPPKNHLQDEHHFRTSDNAVAAGAPPASAESDQEDVNESATVESSTSSEQIHEAVVENPTIAPDVGNQEDLTMSLSENLSESLTYGQPSVQSADIIGSSSQEQEDPIEEKIPELVEYSSLNGWHFIDTEIVIEMPPRNGMPIRLTDKPDGEGTLAIWKKTRKFANSTHRWMESGKWVSFQTGMDIQFEPKYWKERF